MVRKKVISTPTTLTEKMCMRILIITLVVIFLFLGLDGLGYMKVDTQLCYYLVNSIVFFAIGGLVVANARKR